ncbi:MAG: hypothetical protein DI535_22895 [Citrobacter freundii]|nr:MAG: hypothetical protein DI535_22895 [Citrobacter freundii]
MAQFDHLKHLLETIRTTGFWERLFSWKRITARLVLAERELTSAETLTREQDKKFQLLQTELQWQKQQALSNSARKDELTQESAQWKEKYFQLQREFDQLQQQHTVLLANERSRQQDHTLALDSLTRIENRVRDERSIELEQRNLASIERLQQLKETWSAHEQQVRSIIKSICQRHTIDYVETAPFRGTPDNTLSICEEFVVLDAKSPAGDDASNFPTYLKDQAERAHKYARQASVKPEIYFVVPATTLSALSHFVYKFADYTVYVISIDALEPVLLNLKKIEEYEFAKELTPEDRNTICSLLGRFAHLSKRRIQVDSFFARQFIQLAYKAEADLPKDILASVLEFERSEKLNPPQEKRNKAISLPEIEKDILHIKQEADSRGIIMKDEQLADGLANLPLYKQDENPQ